MSPHIDDQSESSASDSMPKPYLLFDAGGTLVFPDQCFLIQQAQAHGIGLTEAELFNGYYRLINTLDCQARKTGRFPCNYWPQGYARDILESFGINDALAEAIDRDVEVRAKEKSLWAFTFPWVNETLARLAAQGYRMSVISNSNDHTGTILSGLGLAHYFERIFYSAALGVEKPDPRIFEIALSHLAIRPTDTLYIGDVFEVDVRGANAAGIGGVLLDPFGFYSGWPGFHLPDIRYLPVWLADYVESPSTYDLFPCVRSKSSQVGYQSYVAGALVDRFDESSN